MSEQKENTQLKKLLAEALELLGDVKHKMEMFEMQRYVKFISKAEQHEHIPDSLKSGLDSIKTSD